LGALALVCSSFALILLKQLWSPLFEIRELPDTGGKRDPVIAHDQK